MATVFPLSASSMLGDRGIGSLRELEQFVALGLADVVGRHRITDDPTDADLILFIERLKPDPFFASVRRHPFVKAWPEKCFVFCSGDRPLPLFRGVYTSTDNRWYDASWCRGGPYLGITETSDLFFRPAALHPNFLFSFAGSSESHSVRKRVLSIKDNEAMLIDTACVKKTLVQKGDVDVNTWGSFRSDYVQLVWDSAFVLCPRGTGTATFRVFESMICGRAPVIIADRWVPPDGPRWSEFAVWVKEGDVDQIPDILRERRSDARTMGDMARAQWEVFYSQGTCFDTIVQCCVRLGPGDRAGATLSFGRFLGMISGYHLLRLAIHPVRLLESHFSKYWKQS